MAAQYAGSEQRLHVSRVASTRHDLPTQLKAGARLESAANPAAVAHTASGYPTHGHGRQHKVHFWDILMNNPTGKAVCSGPPTARPADGSFAWPGCTAIPGGSCVARCADGFEATPVPPSAVCSVSGAWLPSDEGACTGLDLCANVTCDAPPNVGTLNSCSPLNGQCILSNVPCPTSPGPSTRVVLISKHNFAAETGVITFSEKSTGTINPAYSASDYGATSSNAPNVTFAGFFQGQALSAAAGTDCPGGAASGCVAGVPSRPLSLAASPDTFITPDRSSPTPPVFSGTPLFNGPIAILFSTPVVGFGLDGGFFDVANGAAITAFDENGKTLLRVANSGRGIEFLGLATDDGSALIKGVLFSLVGAAPGGLAVDNIRFTYG